MRTSLLIIAAGLFALPAAAQVTPCTFDRGEPTCNQAGFQKTFAVAATVRYNQATLDPYAARQLAAMLSRLGKEVVSPGEHAGLVFELSQPNTDGIFVGPSGIILARLRVYAGNGRTLLWEETYRDQPDVPWQSAVLYVLQQFRDRIAVK